MKIALKMTALMIGLTGIVYPLFVTFISQFTMPKQADGSLVKRGDQIIGLPHCPEF